MEKLSLLDMVASRKAVASYDSQPGWGVLNPPTYNSSSANWGGLANLPPASYINNPSNLEGGDIISSSYASTITTSSSLLGRVFMPPYSPSATLLSPNYQLTTDKLAVLPSRRSWQEFLAAPDLPFTANTATPQQLHCWSRSKKPNMTTTTTSSSTTTTTTTTSSSSNSTSFCHQELISFQQPAANLEVPFSSNLVDTSHDIVSKRVVLEDCCLSDISANKLASQIMITAAAAVTAISLPQSSSRLELAEKPNHISSTKWVSSPLACMDETKPDETQIQPFLNPNTIATKKFSGMKRSRSSTDPSQLEALNQDMTYDLDVAMEEGASCINNKVLEVEGNLMACTTSSGAATKSSSQSLESKQSTHYSSGGSSRSKRSRHPLGPALNTNLKPRAKQGTANDPQIVAARNRRERINARLKILQDLVPNGSKVDLVTMLEKAVNYVKFLQLQVQVLSKEDQYNNNNSCSVEI